ncbi:MAG: hypothetical protein MK193_01660 [Lentisphaeria bacterium]|nr:hypothetical protein [Lentisphaeria bacterium]
MAIQDTPRSKKILTFMVVLFLGMIALTIMAIYLFQERMISFKCKQRMQVLGDALLLYAEENDGMIPVDMEMFKRRNFTGRNYIWQCPFVDRDHSKVSSWDADFIFIQNIPNLNVMNEDDKKSQILFYCKPTNHIKKQNFYYADGHIETKALKEE